MLDILLSATSSALGKCRVSGSECDKFDVIKFPDNVMISFFIGISFCTFIHVVVPCIYQVLGEDSVTFPNFRNLMSLLLDICDLSDNFKTLEHFLKNSPDLEKLTLRCCKVYCTLAF